MHATALISIIFHLQNTQRRQRRERVFTCDTRKWTNTFSNSSVHILQMQKKGNI